MIAVTSCWHLSGDRLDDRLIWIEKALRDMHERGVRAILHCGDLFHHARIGTKDAPAPVIIEGLKAALARYRIPIFAAVGNHDQVPGYDCSAVHAMDGFPYFAYMGGFQSFELPVAGFEDVGFVAVDWEPRMGLRDWKSKLQKRVSSAGKRWVVVFGHVDLPDVSELDLHSASWPRPTYRDLDDVAHDSEADEVSYFFGHNHKGSAGRSIDYCHVQGVCALARLRWDEKDHTDGWIQLDARLGVEHVLLDGPRFVNLADGSATSLPHTPRLMDRVRLSSKQDEDLDASMFRMVGTVEVVPDVEQERQRSNVRETRIEFGATPVEAFQAWVIDQEILESDSLPALAQLYDLLQQTELPVDSEPRIRQIVSVEVRDHVAFPRGGFATFEKSGWSCLVGPTGSGKSTLLEAPFAALYGSWPSTYRRGERQLWRPFTQDKGQLEVTVRVGESDLDLINVDRYRRDGQHVLHANWGADLHHLSPYTQPTKVQPVVSGKVDDPDLWLRSGFLTQDHDPDLVESPPEARLKALNQVLGIHRIAAVKSEVSARRKKLSPALARLEEDSARLLEALGEASQVEKDLASARDRLRALEELVAGQAPRMAEIEAAQKRVFLVAQVKDLASVVAAAPTKEDVQKLTEVVQNIRECVDKQRLDVQNLQDEAYKVEQGMIAERKLCRVGCAGNLLPCVLIDDAKALKDEADQLVQAGFRLEELKAAQDLLQGTHRELLRANSYLADMTRRYDEGESARRQLGRLREAHDLDTLDAAFDMIAAEEEQRAYQASLDEANRIRGYVPVQESRLVQWSSQVEDLRKRVQSGRKAEKEAEALDLLEFAFGRDGIQRAMLEQGLPGIQAELDKLTSWEGLSDLRIHIDYQGDAVDAAPQVLVSVRGGPWIEARPLSGGQRALVRLLVRLACCLWVAKSRGHGGVLVLDEPTAGVSEAYSDAVAGLLRELVGPGRPFCQGILSTHDEVLAQALGGKVIRVAPPCS